VEFDVRVLVVGFDDQKDDRRNDRYVGQSACGVVRKAGLRGLRLEWIGLSGHGGSFGIVVKLQQCVPYPRFGKVQSLPIRDDQLRLRIDAD
jgi:hypothetical protein